MSALTRGYLHMQRILNRLLFLMSVGIVLLDAIWLTLGHFSYDATGYERCSC